MKTYNLTQMAKFLGVFNRTDEEDPLKVFRFHVEIDGLSRFGFSKCSRLKGKTEQIRYREGGYNTTTRKSPGLTEFDDITLERGQILAAGAGDTDILNWYKQVFDVSSKQAGSSKSFRRDVDIVQFDKEGEEIKRWRALECWPTEHSPTGDFDAMQNDNSIESLVLCCEGYYLVENT